MPIRIVRAENLVRTPWKNGGGTTSEVAVHPEGAGLEDFGWRLSIADVGADGPFSIFHGIDRTLTVLTGAGIELIGQDSRHRLDQTSPMLAFAGDAAITGRLIGGPIRDFNVMTRRNAYWHEVKRQGPGSIAMTTGTSGWTIWFADREPCMLDVGSADYRLGLFDFALMQDPSPIVTLDRPLLSVRIVKRE
jgi:uncharacterized protein